MRVGGRYFALVAVACVVAACDGTSATSRGTATHPSRPHATASYSVTPAAKHYTPQPLPPGPAALDVEWTSPHHGWLLAARKCGRGQCTGVYRTVDGGTTWTALARLAGRVGIDTGVAFADATTGYFFNNHLFRTVDGGRTWAREPLPNVESVALVGGRVVALVYDHTGCPGPCGTRVEVSEVGSGEWSVTKRLVAPYADFDGSLSVAGVVVVAVDQGDFARPFAKGSLAVSSDGGSTWTTYRDPCGGRGRREYDIADATAITTGVVVLCAPHFDHARESVRISRDGGRTFGARRYLPAGMFGQLATSDTSIAVASWALSGTGSPQTYRVLRSADGGRHWRPALTTADPLYDRPDQLVGISRFSLAPSGLGSYVVDPAHVWRTMDRGRTWTRVALPAS